MFGINIENDDFGQKATKRNNGKNGKGKKLQATGNNKALYIVLAVIAGLVIVPPIVKGIGNLLSMLLDALLNNQGTLALVLIIVGLLPVVNLQLGQKESIDRLRPLYCALGIPLVLFATLAQVWVPVLTTQFVGLKSFYFVQYIALAYVLAGLSFTLANNTAYDAPEEKDEIGYLTGLRLLISQPFRPVYALPAGFSWYASIVTSVLTGLVVFLAYSYAIS